MVMNGSTKNGIRNVDGNVCANTIFGRKCFTERRPLMTMPESDQYSNCFIKSPTSCNKLRLLGPMAHKRLHIMVTPTCRQANSVGETLRAELLAPNAARH